MGYWATSLSGASLQLYGDLNPDGSEMLWGDSPADCIDAGLDKLIRRLKDELGRFPTVEEVDAVKASAPEMVSAISEAKESFLGDVERPMTDGELAAGLAFSDTELAVDSAQRRDIAAVDTIRFAVFREMGFYKEIDHVVDAVVESESISPRVGITGRIIDVPIYLARDPGGKLHEVEFAYASKVLPGDRSVDEVNAGREARG